MRRVAVDVCTDDCSEEDEFRGKTGRFTPEVGTIVCTLFPAEQAHRIEMNCIGMQIDIKHMMQN